MNGLVRVIYGFVGALKAYGWDILEGVEIVDFSWFRKVLSLFRECDKVRRGLGLGSKIRIDIF